MLKQLHIALSHFEVILWIGIRSYKNSQSVRIWPIKMASTVYTFKHYKTESLREQIRREFLQVDE